MTNPTFSAITANIALIETRLARAAVLADMAHKAAQSGEQNLAIGTLVPVEKDIADADALLRTVFVLHRSRPDDAEGGAQ